VSHWGSDTASSSSWVLLGFLPPSPPALSHSSLSTAASVHGGEEGPVFEALVAREAEDPWGSCRRCEMVPSLPSPSLFFLLPSGLSRVIPPGGGGGAWFRFAWSLPAGARDRFVLGAICVQTLEGWNYLGFCLHGRSSPPMQI
jgi:hypothetical protein